MKDLNAYWSQRLSGKRIIITGGTTGIGREISLLLASLGANCLICGRHQEQINETVAVAENAGSIGQISGLAIDLAKTHEIESLFEQADERLGGLDILINNAALGYGSVTEGSDQDISYIVQTNLTSYLACSHHAIKRMETHGGHIVNIGSMSADVREEGSSVYVATKAGIQGFSEAMRKEINSKKIKVTLIEPGAVDTDMQPGSQDEKLAQIDNLEMMPGEDIAMAVVFCLAQHERCDIVGMQIRPHLQLI